MKFILLLLLSPFFCFTQNDKYIINLSDGVQDSVAGTSIVLKNHAVLFQKVYTSKLEKEELSDRLYTLLATIKKFRYDRHIYPAENQFIGKLVFYMIDGRRYGATAFTTPAVLAYPLTATVSIHVKDFKYRVIITDMNFKDPVKVQDPKKPATNELVTDVMLDDYLTQKRRSQLKNSKTALRVAQFISQDLADRFDLQKSILSDDF